MHLQVVLALLFTSVPSNAVEERVLPGTVSPNKQFAVLEVRADDGERDYYFVHQPSRRRIGSVLPRAQRRQISNVALVASWNKSSAKVALLVFYGTKLSELLIHSRGPDGTFQEVELRTPNPLAVFRQRTGKSIEGTGSGYNENAVGPWLDEDTVILVAGEAKQILPPESQREDVSLDEYTHVFVTFQARGRGRSATVSDLRLIGPLNNAASKDFQTRWGERYFPAHE